MSKPLEQISRGYCRGNNTHRLAKIIQQFGGVITIADAAKLMNRGIAYTRSLAEDCSDIKIEPSKLSTRVGDKVLSIDAAMKGEGT